MPPLFLCRIKSTVADLQSEVEEAVNQIQNALGNTEAVMERQASHHQAGPRLVMRDGVHLFDPTAPHHKVLAQRGVATTAAGTSKPCQKMWQNITGAVVIGEYEADQVVMFVGTPNASPDKG
jgi:hypothetical protein